MKKKLFSSLPVVLLLCMSGCLSIKTPPDNRTDTAKPKISLCKPLEYFGNSGKTISLPLPMLENKIRASFDRGRLDLNLKGTKGYYSFPVPHFMPVSYAVTRPMSIFQNKFRDIEEYIKPAEKRELQPEKPALIRKAVPTGPVETQRETQTVIHLEEREVFTGKDDRLEIRLDGNGWLFLGQQDSKTKGIEGVDFFGVKSGNGVSSFSFFARNIGEYKLLFQLQNNINGTIKNMVIHLKVVPEDKFADITAGVKMHKPEEKKLLLLSELETSLVTFLKDYREGDPYLNDCIAEIYSEMGEHEAAIRYFARNLDGADEYADKAVIGIIRSGLALQESGQSVMACEVFNEYLRRYPRSLRLDEIYYYLAQLYEVESKQRDLKKSMNYYKKVYEDFPESIYSDDSYERIRYLERYFFRIQ